jgi:hypothetical protein
VSKFPKFLNHHIHKQTRRMDAVVGIARNTIGDECFEKVIVQHILDDVCVKTIISKLLGLCFII